MLTKELRAAKGLKTQAMTSLCKLLSTDTQTAFLDPAERELLKRTKARHCLEGFAEYVELEDPPVDHHRLLCRELDAVERGDTQNLAVMMPPGCAKSTYATKLFAAYYLGRHDDEKVIVGSYGKDLSTHFGGQIRNLVRSQKYENVFPGRSLAVDSKAKSEWDLITEDEDEDDYAKRQASFLGVGVGSGVTGHRAHGIIIDDPVRNRKDADSLTVRESTWKWYLDDIDSRMLPGAWRVIIQTRWHEDDLLGRILPEDWKGESGDIVDRNGETWRVVCLPAVIETQKQQETDPLGRKIGEVLWGDFYTPDHWRKKKRRVGERSWGALYQQTPSAEEGLIFKREWFWRYDPDHLPKTLYKYLHSDFAATEKSDNPSADWTEMYVSGIAPDNQIYLALDGFYEQCDTATWIALWVEMAQRHRLMHEFHEGGVIRRAVEPFAKQARKKGRVHTPIEWLNTSVNKVLESTSFQGLAADGRVGIPLNDMGDRILRHLLAFPTSDMDHSVDACSKLGRGLEKVWTPKEPKDPPKPKRRDYGRSQDIDGAMVA